MDRQTNQQEPPLDVLVRLTHTFGAPFERWRRIAGAWRRDDAQASSRASALTPLLNNAVAKGVGVPLVCRTADGDLWIGVLLGGAHDEPMVAAAIVVDAPDRYAERLATLVLASERAELKNSEQQLLLDGYAHRLADNFEELTFLRKLSHHVEYCDATRGLGDVAAAVLPALCDLMAIEGLVLLAAKKHATVAEVHGVLASAGYVPHAIETCQAKVEELITASRGVVVRNFAGLAGDQRIDGDVRSLVIAPLAKEDHLFGWLVGCNKRAPVTAGAPVNSLGHDEIGSMEASLLEAAAGMLATHAANVRLFHEKEDLVVDAIHTLVGVIEAKDAYTCGHSDRVALIAHRIGKELGLPESECHDIFLAGLLHDIGKVGVADDVLLKPGRLQDDEFEQIKRHPGIGYRMLQRLEPLAYLLPGVLHHHESLDGSGYPDGLRGDEIPFHARVLAVADAWDAMTSDRPYRQGMPWEKAEGILRDGAGSQWDPNVVNAFLAAREDIRRITRSWQDHLKQILRPGAAKAQNQTSAPPLAFIGDAPCAPSTSTDLV